ncbi:YolD-like family protein [Lederbergia lenta]|uniref:YolD-like family protein n=1 Tax=Lederbergia lenta TaxID=1467 RepID=A0A2X4VWJ8_LEDLE|nr:YolD-like family protein [Lederbergia lenta]MEC2325099.1 YolD-like family protein [Lederbergia lenta]SQI56406.1 yolD-like family protein [Lederbergia lenta]
MIPNKLTPGYNVRWESSRMMLPEHREQLLKERSKQEEFTPPILDNDQLEEINRIIIISMEQKQEVIITFIEKYGPAQFSGWIQNVDRYERWIRLDNDQDTLLLFFKEILQIDFL